MKSLDRNKFLVAVKKVAIRFRWIWVEKHTIQAAHLPDAVVAIRFRWIWVEKLNALNFNCEDSGRNPLSLDMG